MTPDKQKRSKYEIKIHDYLTEHNIFFYEQTKLKAFDKYKNQNILLFCDFFVIHENQKFVIEYDGIQHFQPVEAFGGEEEFKRRVQLDKVKNREILKRGYKLLRIRYDNKDWKKTINQFLNI